MPSVCRAVFVIGGLACSVLLVTGWAEGGNPDERAMTGGPQWGPSEYDEPSVESATEPAAESDQEPGWIPDPYGDAALPTDDAHVSSAERSTRLPALENGHGARSKQGVSAGKGKQRTVKRVYRVTAYCDDGTTASGRHSGVGQCAAPIQVPFGAKVHIPKLKRTLVVTDRTHRRFRHNTVDIFMPSSWACKQFGRQYLECVVVLPPNGP